MATQSPYTKEPEITIALNEEGSHLFSKITTKLAGDNNRELAIVIDGRVVSAPRVNEPITGGQLVISGRFYEEEARYYAKLLTTAALPCTLQLIAEH